jgi:ATP-dependent DNA helicase HFM1/MER3
LTLLLELAAFGIGVHHAGLTIDDRRAVEDLYLKGLLRVVVATSVCIYGTSLYLLNRIMQTLAVGVNLRTSSSSILD